MKTCIFQDDFTVHCNGVPANWQKIKYSSNTPEAMRINDGKCQLIVPGDCFMPLISDLQNSEIVCNASTAHYDPALKYELRADFRYDPCTRTGLSARFIKTQNSDEAILCWGAIQENKLTVKAQKKIKLKKNELSSSFSFVVKTDDDICEVSFNKHRAKFKGLPVSNGRVAIGRGNFFDIINLENIQVFGEEKLKKVTEKSFRFKVNEGQTSTVYPVFCDIKLDEYQDFFEVSLELSGGSHLTPAGEGFYHVMRMEEILNPYLKLITPQETVKYTLFDGRMMLYCKEIAPPFHYGILFKKPEWPFKRTLRFARPENGFLLAVGGDKFYYGNALEFQTTPAETVVTANGEIIFSDFAILEKGSVQISLLSDRNKAAVKRIPSSDARYQQAVEHIRKGHYFEENENLKFTFAVTGYEIPEKVRISLLDAFLHETMEISAFTTAENTIDCNHIRQLIRREYTFQLPPLPVGVYHLQLTSLDPTLSAREYFAFEIMPQDNSQPTAAVQSGLPFIHTCYTETRGLDTDGFDLYRPVSGNVEHYVSCSDFLPWFARKMKLIPTLHAFGRKYFAWLGGRCLEKWHIADNMDIIAEADFAHFGVELQMGGIFGYYRGRTLRMFIDFAKSTNDPFYDIDELKKNYAADDKCPDKYFDYTVCNHWVEWAEFAAKSYSERLDTELGKLRKYNPNLKLAKYGPAAMYNSLHRGAEHLKYMGAYCFRPDQVGFLQYEDYPDSCDYPPHRGSFYLGTIAMAMPGFPITPEIYGAWEQGCPDGAVFFAKPPFGQGPDNIPSLLAARIYEYAYATAYFTEGEFGFWNRFGFQISLLIFEKERTELFLKCLGNVHRNQPTAPLKSSAYVFSWDSWRTNNSKSAVEKSEEQVEGTSINIKNTATESVPFCAGAAADAGVLNGFQMFDTDLLNIAPEKVDIIFLPPLRGVKPEIIAAIRKLHESGVSIVSFERADGLEDLFGIKETNQFTKINYARATADFLSGIREYVADKRFGGWYISADAEILIDGEVPVLTAKQNGKASAIFFNAPPTASVVDMLQEREGLIGRDVTSRLMRSAVAEIHKRYGDADAVTSYGRLIGAKTAGGAVLTVSNPARNPETAVITYRKNDADMHIVSCDAPYTVLEDTVQKISVKIRLEAASSAFITINCI